MPGEPDHLGRDMTMPHHWFCISYLIQSVYCDEHDADELNGLATAFNGGKIIAPHVNDSVKLMPVWTSRFFLRPSPGGVSGSSGLSCSCSLLEFVAGVGAGAGAAFEP